MVWVENMLGAVLSSVFAIFLTATAFAAPSGSDLDFTRAATAAVERIEREDGFSGVILVARGDQVLLRKAGGYADRERNIPNTPETKFPLASVSKQFTAAAIMLLVQDGKVSLDDPISKFYPASPPLWKEVTIKHLLHHSSGVADYWLHHPEVRAALDGGRLFHSYDELIRLAINEPLAFPTGTGFEYSNAGYALLTAAVERVSGQSFGDFMGARIFAPLGMNNTGYGSIPENSVQGYVRSPDGGLSSGAEAEFLDTTGGAGGFYSTLDDMLIWSRALESDKVLSAPSRAAMFTDYGSNYGLGWRFAPKFGRNLIWHTGNGWNFTAILDRFPEETVTIVAMSNSQGMTDATATLLIEGKVTTFPANAMRKLVEEVERLYFGREP